MNHKENTSYISTISYNIENWLAEGKDLDEIKSYIKKAQKEGKFPANLELVDAHFNEKDAMSVCAFFDKNTGETIIGVPGTNPHGTNENFIKDVITDGVGLGMGGISENSDYLKSTNEFIQGLKKQGYNITEVTGHSLGGALAVYLGLYHEIENIKTYNGAPPFVLDDKMGSKLISEILLRLVPGPKYAQGPIPDFVLTKFFNYLIKNSKYLNGAETEELRALLDAYKGDIDRIVSSGDPLNNLLREFGYYKGDEFVFPNGNGHDMDKFLDALHQKRFSDEEIARKVDGIELGILDESSIEITLKDGNPEFTIKNGEIGADLDGDGKNDITLDNNDLIVKNLWTSDGLYSGVGKIVIDPEAFQNLSNNLKEKIVGSDLEEVKNTINLCKIENDRVKNNYESRDNTLCESIVEILDEAGLKKALEKIADSHGALCEYRNKNTLRELSNCSIYGTIAKLDRYGVKWFLGGQPFDEQNLITWIKNLKEKSENLYEEITDTGEFKWYEKLLGCDEKYKYNSISEIVEAFNNTTNNFLGKTAKVFPGSGLRSAKDDGIVDSISEVLDIEWDNIQKIESQILNIAEIAEGIGINFEEMDIWLSKSMEGVVSGAYSYKNVPINYTTYLEEYNIFDDVIGVLQAADLQVEQGARGLVLDMMLDFEDLVESANIKLKKITTEVKAFKIAVNELDSRLDKTITSREWEAVGGQYEMEKELVTKQQGTLRSFLPREVVDNIKRSKTHIIPLIEELELAHYSVQGYGTMIPNLENYFRSIIEKAVYEYADLDAIVKAQNIVAAKIQRIIKEISKVNNEIGVNFQGESITEYQRQLNSIVTTLNYFNSMIIDCFGENLN